MIGVSYATGTASRYAKSTLRSFQMTLRWSDAVRTGLITLVAAAVFTTITACARQSPAPASAAVTVEALDYAFRLPDSLAAGPTQLRLHNAGKMAHEMGMSLLKPGVSVRELLAHVDSGGDPADLTDGVVGILIAEPGETTLGTLAVDLAPGRSYVFWCNFQDAPDKPPHLALGMFSERSIHAVTAAK